MVNEKRVMDKVIVDSVVIIKIERWGNYEILGLLYCCFCGFLFYSFRVLFRFLFVAFILKFGS